MYVDSSQAARRPVEASRRRGDCRKPARQTTIATAESSTKARRTRLDDAIVSQWLLEQLPSDHRALSQR